MLRARRAQLRRADGIFRFPKKARAPLIGVAVFPDILFVFENLFLHLLGTDAHHFAILGTKLRDGRKAALERDLLDQIPLGTEHIVGGGDAFLQYVIPNRHLETAEKFLAEMVVAVACDVR